MNQQTADTYAAMFEAFIVSHPVVTCIALAWVASWVVTIAARPWLKLALPDSIERHAIRTFDTIIAGVAAFKMWPGTYPVIWALCIGGSSPIAYFALSELLCWWKPNLRKYLSLRELAADDLPAERIESTTKETQ